MGEKIVLLEFADEADAFLRYCENQATSPDCFHIIALQPQVQVFLKNLNIPYENTLPYFSNQSHARALSKSEEWYQFLATTVDIEDGPEIKETYNNTFLFYLRFYIHHYIMHIEVLSSIYEKHKIESIYACVYQNDVRPNNPPLIQDDERYAGIIAKIFSQTHNIAFQEIPTQFKPKVIQSNKSLLIGFKENTEKMISRLYKFLLVKNFKHKKVILLTTTGYNIGNLARRLKKELPTSRWAVISASKPSRCIIGFILRSLSEVFKTPSTSHFSYAELSMGSFQSTNTLSNESYCQLEKGIDLIIYKFRKYWPNCFTYNGVNFTGLILERIEKDLKPHLVSLYLESKALREILRLLEVRLVISPYARDTSLMIGGLCQNLRIPALMISHGTLIRPKNKMESIEYYHLGKSLILSEFYNYVAIQTPSEEEHLHYYQCNNQMIKTGPLIFSKPYPTLRESIKNKMLGYETDKKILLYPDNTKERFTTRFQVYETFDEFLSSSIHLVDAINEIEGVHLVIRLHPGKSINPAD
ncbi:hypothetical protein ACFLWL_04040 [Chloroflexota bacterium]